jgi:hypothetical protein
MREDPTGYESGDWHRLWSWFPEGYRGYCSEPNFQGAFLVGTSKNPDFPGSGNVFSGVSALQNLRKGN